MKKWTKAYQQYREKFYSEKRRGNIKNGLRVFSAKQFQNALKYGEMKEGDKKVPYTPTRILNKQKKLSTKAAERATWRAYLKMRKGIERGERISVSDSFLGLTKTDEGGISLAEAMDLQEDASLGYHYGISGLLKNNYALHDIISFRITEGEEQKEVLADYGY